MQRWKHLVVQFLILYLSCNLSSHSGLNEHTSGTQDNHIVKPILYCYALRLLSLAAFLSNYCLCIKI